uniref:Bacteriophage/plasmid primase P4 C-terminal domain-containing protein n=1 Tax=viral metagenome TaxID=1070528 RepID=A0A6C0CGN3_9ZZZZ
MEEQTCYGVPASSVQCAKLLSLLGVGILGDHEKWKFVGQCVYNILGASGRSLFERYTPQKFQAELENFWSDLQKTKHGLAALKVMAKRANRSGLDLWMREVVHDAAAGSLVAYAGMTEIADLARFLFGHEFVCSDAKAQEWWHFNGIIWEKLSAGHSMKQKFSRELSPIYLQLLIELEGVRDSEGINPLIKRCTEITRGLKEPGFKSVLMQECGETFFIKDFYSNCDEDHYLLGLPNGVYDFHKMILRDAYPEDMITLQMGVPLDEGLSWEHPDVKYVMDFFRKVLYKPDLIDFCLKHTATCLMGGNTDKLFVMNIGPTAHNGKTTRAALDRFTFGKYSGKLPLGVLVGKTPDSTTADPALAGTKGTRLQQLDESNKLQEFNASFLKNNTGNDEIWCRPLYSNGFHMIPQFTLVLYGNEPPGSTSSGGDAGMNERTVWVPHDSRFTMDAPDDEAEQWKTRTFKADPHIKIELHKRAHAYLWLLFEYLKRYKAEGLKKPDEVLEKTRLYQYKNDIRKQFVDTFVEVTNRHADYVGSSDLFSSYRVWYGECFPDRKGKMGSREDFEGDLLRILKISPIGGEKRYHGIKLKTEVRVFDRSK